MAKAVTLKNSSNEEVYPVTDISLVNGGIYADTLSTLEPTTGYISTAMLQDEAVTNSKIDWSGISGSGSIRLGDVLIQWGQSQLSSAYATSNYTVNIPTSYGNSNYNVMVTPVFDEGGQSYWWAFALSRANQSFVVRAGYKAVNSSGGAGGNVVVNWLTIGTVSS